MKTLPPIPPNNPRFRKTSDGFVLWIFDAGSAGDAAIPLNDPTRPIRGDARLVPAADAEVAWRKEHARLGEELNRIPRSHHMLAEAKMSLLCDARDAAAAWRSWAEPEIESEEDHEPE